MGTWGAKLYQDDIAQDVRDKFKDLLRRGKTAEEITKNLIAEYEYAINDSDDGPIFWFALADTQWELGRLMPEVKKQAVACLDKGGDLAKWQIENPKLVIIRKKVLDELGKKLNSPQPPEKKILQYKLYACEWNLGDVFAYQLRSELAKAKGLFGRYFLIQKIDETTWYPGHIIPIVYVKITMDDKLPTNVDEYNQLEFVQTWFTKYEDRFLPIDGRRHQEDIAEKNKLLYEVDDYGFLPQYRIRLLNTSKKVIPSELIFIGNFQSSNHPKKEFIPHSKDNLASVSWKNVSGSFETEMIKKYCGHNLKELQLYKSSIH